ncbi:MAG TPA: hypothetical protein VMS98_03445 [Thermoanaerobaculia bacterium]|nr:hypothetical protein [Thermoanaerobaculia bacterium]
MHRRDIHQQSDFHEYVRIDDGSVPPADPARIDVAVLDMNHSWPNVGHDALVHAVVEAAEEYRPALTTAGLTVRVISYDVRRRFQLPEAPNGRFSLYLGTGGPGHLDPRRNDGVQPWAQGIKEDPAWEKPLFRLFESIHGNPRAALVAVCHSFGLLCRWSGVATPQMRPQKSSGMPMNVLSGEGASHPWFSRFSRSLQDGRTFRVVDNRLFDLDLERRGSAVALAFDATHENAVTMIELARDPDTGMPRVLGVNHHPEIIDREHILAVLEEKRVHRDVSEAWYRERAHTMSELFQGESERQSRVTSEFTLLGVLRHHVGRLVESRSQIHP